MRGESPHRDRSSGDPEIRREHPTLIRNRELEPETAQLVGAIFGTGPTVAELTPVPTAIDFLATYWQRIAEASDARRARSGLRRGGES